MTEHSSMHWYVTWTKERLDEMDATLASLEAKANQVKEESKAKADQLIADMKKRRDEFQAKVTAQAQAGEAAFEATKKQLEPQWQAFEAQDFTAWLIGAYVGTAVNNPKRYPKKPDKVTIKEPPKPTTEMTSDTLKDVLTVFAEMHNATEGAKRHDLRRTSN